MSSRYVHELREYAERMRKDGYPTALLERCADRMAEMEKLIVNIYENMGNGTLRIHEKE